MAHLGGAVRVAGVAVAGARLGLDGGLDVPGDEGRSIDQPDQSHKAGSITQGLINHTKWTDQSPKACFQCTIVTLRGWSDHPTPMVVCGRGGGRVHCAEGFRGSEAHFGSLLAKSGQVEKCSQHDIFFMNSLRPRENQDESLHRIQSLKHQHKGQPLEPPETPS